MLHYQGWSIASTKVTLEPISSAIIRMKRYFPDAFFLCCYILVLQAKDPITSFIPAKPLPLSRQGR